MSIKKVKLLLLIAMVMVSLAGFAKKNGTDNSSKKGEKSKKEETVKEEESLIKEDPFYGVWVKAYKDREDADAIVEKLSDKGYDAATVYAPDWDKLSKEPYYCVTAGKCETKEEADKLLKEVKADGYKDAYVKYSGERIGDRIYYYCYSEEDIDFSRSEVVLNDVPVESLAGEDLGEMTLIVDRDTEFDETCDMDSFGNYKKNQSVLKWFNQNNKLMNSDPDKYMSEGPALQGVFEVSITGDHIDRFYGCYWWD
ncbi:MAG: SPOR domain-containing protein [Lachnospiraceae bacterium]|nr:SPOR domain-containing protein [Lachnospiraceae bacterium]